MKYPSTGYGMSAPSAQTSLMNKLAASNNASAGTSSWKMPAPSWSSSSSSSSFPTLKGATGNNLYPAPSSSSTNYGSLLSGLATSKPGSFSLPSSTPNRPSGGILGGAGQSSTPAPSWKMPAPSWSSAPNAAPSSSSLRMPAGFSAGALGSATPQAQPQAASNQGLLAAPARSSTYPTGAAPQPDHTKSNAGGVAYTGMKNQPQTHSSVTGPGALSKGIPAQGTKQGVDQWGRTFYYNENPAAGSVNQQQVVGVSNTGTVLRSYTDSRGVTHTYDTGVAAFEPVKQQPRPAQAITAVPIVGGPTQTSQPVAVPTVPARQPTPQDEIDTANQGRWLG